MYVDTIVSQLKLLIPQNSSLTNPLNLIVKVMEMVAKEWPVSSGQEKRELLIQVLTVVAAGADGVEGTSDDVLPADLVRSVKLLLDNNLVAGMADILVDAAKGKFTFKDMENVAKVVDIVEDIVTPENIAIVEKRIDDAKHGCLELLRTCLGMKRKIA